MAVGGSGSFRWFFFWFRDFLEHVLVAKIFAKLRDADAPTKTVHLDSGSDVGPSFGSLRVLGGFAFGGIEDEVFERGVQPEPRNAKAVSAADFLKQEVVTDPRRSNRADLGWKWLTGSHFVAAPMSLVGWCA